MNNEETSIEKQHVLIVDDRLENLLSMDAILQAPDRNIVKATSGKEALWLLLEYQFALIILDVQMPDMNGFETAEQIRDRERTSFIPIIFVTAINKEQQHVFKGYEAGAVDYLFKPIEPEILQSKVRVFLELYRQKQLIVKQTDQLRKEIAERVRAEEKLKEVNASLEQRVAERTSELTDANAALAAEIAHRKQLFDLNKTIIRTATNGFWILDIRGKILDVNDAHCRLCGYSREELLNMNLSDIEASETPEDTAQRIQKTINSAMTSSRAGIDEKTARL